ncbi:hypothetical protein [Stutzerimonas balearica]|uniref:hypothetical protein n=1 Tax=Stutzerimonas balearica TaxID=74829 RepID=UPI00378704DE
MSQPDNKKDQDNRWWEFYFVRYFIGAALGAFIILFLSISTSPVNVSNQGEISLILKSIKPEKIEGGYFFILAAAGLAFSYIASAPILVMHAVRGTLLKSRSISNKRTIIWFALIVVFFTAMYSKLLWTNISPTKNPLTSADFYFGTIWLLFFAIAIVGQFFLLKLSMYSTDKSSFEYYEKLVKWRASPNAAKQEYIESYRHIREHGNAFFIALLALFLGGVLYYSPVPWAIILVIWIFPAAGVWLFGTLLESRRL